MIMIGHPSFRRLRAFALDDAVDTRARRSTARHLEGCARCRARVTRLRAFLAEAGDDAFVPPPPRAFAAIAARLASGERVLLPVHAPVKPRHRRRSRRVVAAAALAAGAAGAVILGVPEALAERSELHIAPASPQAGATVTLRYRPTARLSGEPLLVVRGRVRPPGQSPRDSRTVALGELHPTRGGLYEGRITLPDSAVYIVLAVEDTAARFVDDNAERWEIVIHDAAGRPTFESLRQRYYDVRMRNSLRAQETLAALVDRYPEHPGSWYLLWGEETSTRPRAEIDAIRARFEAAFNTLEEQVRAADDAEHWWYMTMLAGALGHSERNDRWRHEMIARFPTDPGAIQQAAFLAAERHRGDPAGRLAALDSLWNLAPKAAVQVAFDAMNIAVQRGDAALALRWAARMDETMPDWAATHGHMLAAHEPTRHDGMRRLRLGIEQAFAMARPLTASAADHEVGQRRAAGGYFAALGRALLAEGRATAALDTLAHALEVGWDPALFRTVGDARLQLADTAGALAAYARVAADPNTPAAFADSVRLRLAASPHYTEPGWNGMLRDAQQALRAELLGRSLDRPPLRTHLRLRSLDGEPHDTRLADPRITIVAFWSRYCMFSTMQLARLDEIAVELEQRGVGFLAITDEERGDAVASFLEARGLRFTTYLDPQRDARNAFDNRSTPYYVAVDERGRIRFTSHDVADVLRFVAVLAD
jgi:tetratricopeptide (TPR) repeat protein